MYLSNQTVPSKQGSPPGNPSSRRHRGPRLGFKTVVLAVLLKLIVNLSNSSGGVVADKLLGNGNKGTRMAKGGRGSHDPNDDGGQPFLKSYLIQNSDLHRDNKVSHTKENTAKDTEENYAMMKMAMIMPKEEHQEEEDIMKEKEDGVEEIENVSMSTCCSCIPYSSVILFLTSVHASSPSKECA